MIVDPNTWYTANEVAEILKVKARTLERWRSELRGPPFTYVEGQVRYPGDRLRDYMNGWRADPVDPRQVDLLGRKGG